ncbi:MAG: carboxypeptidase regulatory-like domain-containing protein [Acidobacteriota bacterium]|nr:carboxypeptidase regulatory-like domain-containing protein [Acidobacteriota bacterium]
MSVSAGKSGIVERLASGVLVIVVVMIAFVPRVRAQAEASITGTVSDSSGASVPGATVTVRDVENGFSRKVVTDATGEYNAASLPLGRYDMTAEKQGFDTEVKTGLTLVVGEKAVVNLTLRLGEMKQLVTVKDEGPVVNVTTQATSGLVGEREVKELPLNGRSYDELMTLNPGIVNYTAERTGGVGGSNSAVGNMFAVSGRRPQENLFLLNGIEYTSASEINLTPGGASGELLGVDAVREFNVLSDTYGAQYGKRSGAQVNIVTTSGNNELHGTVYEFLRNSGLDARNFFDQGPIPPFERNEFGGALGGPIQKNKTFIFGNYEGFRQSLGLSDVTLAPDSDARLGLLPGPNGALVNVGVAPGVRSLLSLWPVQNGPDLGGGIGEAFSHPVQTIREDFGTTRLDETFSNHDSLVGVYTIDDSADWTPTANPFSVTPENLREQVVSLEETHVFSSTALNTAELGFSRGGYYFTGISTVSAPGFIQGAPVAAIVVGGGTAVNAASQLTAAGTNVGADFIADRNLFTFTDHVDMSKGVHQLSMGVWFQRIQANDKMAANQYGQASFSSLTSFLKGAISTFTAVPSSTLMGWRSLEGTFFVQDAIKLRPDLELRVGFRDEFTNGYNEAFGRASNFLFSPGGVIESQPHVGDSVFTVNNARFLPEPRVGFAWDTFGKGKTVIHAGFGIYYNLLDNLSYRLDQNPPFNTTVVLKNQQVSSLNIVPGTALPSGSLISPAGVQPNAQTPGVAKYSLEIEQQIAPRTMLSVSYVGSRGYHEMLQLDANEPAPTICPAASCRATVAAGTIYYPKGAPLANPDVANTTTWVSEGESSYNALQVDVNHHFDHGLQLRGVYTYSKSLDDGAAWSSSVAANTPAYVMYPGDPMLDWGLSPFDVRQQAAIDGAYDLPVGRRKLFLSQYHGWREKLVSGWTLTGITTLQSGFPFSPQLGFNPTNNGDTRNPIRPSYNPAFTGNNILGNPNQYFNPNAFMVPVSGTYGNVGRDPLIGPGIAALDLGLTKNTSISERVHLQFRAEFFNIFNHTNFNTPNTVVFTSNSTTPSPTAGVVNSTSTTSRQIQFGLKLIW